MNSNSKGNMEFRSNFQSLIGFLCIITLLFCTSAIADHPFQKVKDRFANESVKARLTRFEKKGFEKRIDTSQYDIDRLTDFTKTFLGTPHRMGGSTRKGIDCSGLVMVAHKEFGIQLPHTCEEQARFGKIVIEEGRLKKGDLVFFYNSFKSTDFITHSGIYLGEGNFIHASYSKGVVITNLNESNYWKTRFLFGTRLKF